MRIAYKIILVPNSSSNIAVEYKSNADARIRWKHFDDERLQHYEVYFIIKQTKSFIVLFIIIKYNIYLGYFN